MGLSLIRARLLPAFVVPKHFEYSDRTYETLPTLKLLKTKFPASPASALVSDSRTGIAASTPLLRPGLLPHGNKRPKSSWAGLNEKPVKTTILSQLADLDTLSYFWA